MRRLVLLMSIVLCVPAMSNAGDLDSARQFWHTANGNLGRDTILFAIDTNASPPGGLFIAVNSCLRKAATHIGVMGEDTIEVKAGNYIYTLNDNFIEDGIVAMGYTVKGVTPNHKHIYSLEPGDPSEITNYVELASAITKFKIDGGIITFSSAVGDGDTLFITGPVSAITFTTGGDTTNVYDQDRSAVCDCAAALFGYQIQHPMAKDYWNLFTAHVKARGGSVEGLFGP